MIYEIINASEKHIEQLENLEKLCFSMPWTKDFLISQLTDDRHIFIVAADGDTVLGYVGMMYVLDEGYISNVAVHPDWRRRGAADALLTGLEERAKKLLLSFLTLEVRESNAPAIALYEKHGFRPVGRRKNYYEKPAEDAILMTRNLE